jgi:hypothetical protein
VPAVLFQHPDAGAAAQEQPALKAQQKVLRAEVRRETGRGRDRFKIRDLFADKRCN